MEYSSDIKEIKEWRLAKLLMYNFVLSIFITLALGVALVGILNLRLDIVLSDSMYPVFKEHDIVVVREYDDYKIGDMVEYQVTPESKPVTHRIVEKTGSGANAIYRTKGEANEEAEPYTINDKQINGKVIGIIFDGEHIYDFIKSNYFLFIDIVLGVWVLSSALNGEAEMRKHNIAKAE